VKADARECIAADRLCHPEPDCHPEQGEGSIPFATAFADETSEVRAPTLSLDAPGRVRLTTRRLWTDIRAA